MVRLLARVMGIGMQEVLSRNLRDRHAVARYAGRTGSPDESGKKRREKGLARSGNPRVRRGMIQLAWRSLMYQKDSALAQWFRTRAENARGTRKTMIVALARKARKRHENHGDCHRHGLPLSVSTHAANHHEVRLVRLCFDFYMIEAKPENLIGDRAYDSDPLHEELRRDGIEMIAPHRANRSKPPTQDRRRLTRYMRPGSLSASSPGCSGSAEASSAGSTTPRIS